MDTTIFAKVKLHHLITLIERDDGKTYKIGEGSRASACLKPV